MWGGPENLLVGLFWGRGKNQASAGWSHVIDGLKYHKGFSLYSIDQMNLAVLHLFSHIVYSHHSLSLNYCMLSKHSELSIILGAWYKLWTSQQSSFPERRKDPGAGKD